MRRPPSARTRTARLRLERLEDRTVPTAFAWIGGAHATTTVTIGDPTAWTNALNWLNTSSGLNNDGVPGASDTATFTDNVTFTLSSPNTTFTHPFNKNAVYNVPGGVSVVGALNFDSTWASTFTVNQSFTLGGTSRWDSGSWSIPAGVTLFAAGTLILNNASPITLSGNGTLANAGLINQTGLGNLFIDSTTTNATRLSNEGIYDFQADASILTHSSATLVNLTVLRKTVTAGGTAASNIGSGIAFTNNNTLDVRQGVLRIGATSVAASSQSFITVSSGANLDLTAAGGTAAYQGTFSGSGAGRVNVGSGTLRLAADTTFNFPAGLLRWSTGTIDTNGKTLTNAGTLSIDGSVNFGSVTLQGNGSLSNTGTISHEGNKTFLCNDALVNQAGAVYDMKALSSLLGGTFTNFGTLRRSAGTGLTRITSRLVNHNVVDLQDGQTEIRGELIGVAGSFTVAPGALVNLQSNLQGTLSGSGGGDVEINGANFFLGDTTLNFAPGMLSLIGTMFSQNKTLTNAGTLTIGPSAGVVGSGTINNSGAIVQTGNFTLSAPSDNSPGSTLINQPGGVYDVQGDFDLTSNGVSTFVNQGTLRKSAGAGTATVSPGLFSNTGTVLSQSGTLFVGLTDGVGAASLPSGIWNVANNAALSVGSFIESVAGTVILDGANSAFSDLNSLKTITGSGILTLQNGRNFTASAAVTINGQLTVGANSTFTAPSVNITAGGLLNGTGTVTAAVSNASIIRPGSSAGVLTVNGSYSQGAGGLLAIELNSTPPGSGYDQLKVNGTVSLAGTLSLTPGFSPALGTQFTIVDNDSTDTVTGAFANLPQGAVITANGIGYQVSYTGGTGSNDVVLTVVIPPPVVTNVRANGGGPRSMVTSIQVTFNTIVSIAADAFTLTYIGTPAGTTGGTVGSTVGGLSFTRQNFGTTTVATLTFNGANTLHGSLIDGRYSLTVKANAISGGGLQMASDFVFADSGSTSGNQLYRLYGDANSDRVVNGGDLPFFIQSFGGTDSTFDFNRDGVVNGGDVSEFVKRFGVGV